MALNSVADSISMSYTSIEEYLESSLISARLNSYTTDSFLGSAAESNFIELSDDQVKARIPLLARISAAVGAAT